MKRLLFLALLLCAVFITSLASPNDYSSTLVVTPTAVTLGASVHFDATVTNLTNHDKVIDSVELDTYSVPDCSGYIALFYIEPVQIAAHQTLTFSTDFTPTCAPSITWASYFYVRTHSRANVLVAKALYTVN
jgi:hypothetical protein